MDKIGVKYCWECGCNTEHIYVGKKVPNSDYVAEVVFSLGLSLLFDPRPRFWKCEKCGKITKE